MLSQLLIGFALVAASIGVTVIAFTLAQELLERATPWLVGRAHPWRRMARKTAALMAVTLWMMFSLTLCVWIWAAAFLALGAFASWEVALYFSAICFTTLGFGDIILGEETRLLSGICAANGLIVFGVTTAFMAEVFRGLSDAQQDAEERHRRAERERHRPSIGPQP